MRSTRFMAPLFMMVAAGTSSTALAEGSGSSGASAAPAATTSTVDITTLRLMLQKGVITQAEYDSALRDLADASGAKAADSNSLVIGKWSATLYGFVEAGMIGDSTQSYTDLPGAALVARPGSYAGTHPRTQFSMRNTRLGFRFRAPEFHSIRASAQIETDFYGDWANPTYTGATGQPSENQFFASPVPRLRHAFLKVETPIVDVLLGQYWQLFGWQSSYHPNTVQDQGIPGEVYSRTPQARISKTFASSDVTVDVALAAIRPPQRDSGIPEGQGGLHLAINNWTGVQTIGGTGTSIAPASIAVTGDVRTFAVANLPASGSTAGSTNDIGKTSAAVAADAFIPVIPGSKEHMGNSLSILGEFVYGGGIGDLYTGLTSGLVSTANVPGTPVAGAPSYQGPTAYNPQIDPGLVYVDGKGNVTVIEWQTIRAGLQYYFPGLDGKMWLSANYANVTALNAPTLLTTDATTGKTNANKIRNALNWFDVLLMGDLTPAVRLGVEYAYSADKYVDGVTGKNHRVVGSGFYIF